MHILTESEFHQNAEPMLRKIFTNYEDDNIFNIFPPEITERRIIFPCYGNFDRAIPIEVLVAAATAIGDDSCYISNIWKHENKPNHCFVYLSEMLIGYCERTPCNDDQIIGLHLGMDIHPLEAAIYSTQGKWGIRMSHEHYGLLGGSVDFMREIEANVPNLSAQIYKFFDACKGSENCQLNINWILPLVRNIYGEHASELILENSSLEFSPYDQSHTEIHLSLESPNEGIYTEMWKSIDFLLNTLPPSLPIVDNLLALSDGPYPQSSSSVPAPPPIDLEDVNNPVIPTDSVELS